MMRGVVNKGLTRQLEIVMNKIRYYTPIDDLVGVKDPILLPYLVADLLSLAMRGQPISKSAQLNVYYPYWTSENGMTLNNDRNGIPYLVTGCILKDGNGLPSKMVELLLKGSEDGQDIFAKLELTVGRADLSGTIVFSPVPFVDGKPQLPCDGLQLIDFLRVVKVMFSKNALNEVSLVDDAKVYCTEFRFCVANAHDALRACDRLGITELNFQTGERKFLMTPQQFEEIFGVKLP